MEHIYRSALLLHGIRASSLAGVASGCILFIAGCSAPVPLVAEPAQLNLGVVGQGSLVRSSFIVRNAAGKPLTIKTLSTSCGCTTVGKFSSLARGQAATLPVTFDSAAFPGRVQKQIVIVTNEYPDDPLVVPLVGEVKPVVRVMPPAVQLTAPLPSGRSRPVTVRIESIDGSPFAAKVTNSPENVRDIVVSQKSPTVIEVRASVVAPSRAGKFRDEVHLSLNHPLLSGVTVPVEYEVPSLYRLSRTDLNFGLLTDSATQPSLSVDVAGWGKDGRGLPRVVHSPPSVQVTLQPISPGAVRVTARLSKPANMGGLLSDRVVLATGDARQPEIVIPVYAAFGRN